MKYLVTLPLILALVSCGTEQSETQGVSEMGPIIVEVEDHGEKAAELGLTIAQYGKLDGRMLLSLHKNADKGPDHLYSFFLMLKPGVLASEIEFNSWGIETFKPSRVIGSIVTAVGNRDAILELAKRDEVRSIHGSQRLFPNPRIGVTN